MAEEGAVISCHNVDHWNEQLQQANASKKLLPLVVWCSLTLGAPCIVTCQEGMNLVLSRQLERREHERVGMKEMYSIMTRKTKVLDWLKTRDMVVVDFTASWCGPCRFITPVLVELAKKLPQVTFLKVDVDELKTVAQDWAIEAMPTFIFLKEGTIIDKVVGARKDELQQKIQLHMAE